MSKLLSVGNSVPEIYPENKQDIPSIEYVQYEAGQQKEETLFFTEIILVNKGEFLLSYDHFLNWETSAGNMFLLPPGCHFTLRAKTRVSICIFRIKEAVRFCERYTVNNVCDAQVSDTTEPYSLEVKPLIETFFSFLKNSLDDGLRHEHYLKLKAEELLYLLRSYYAEDQLVRFFHPLLGPNARFHDFVLRNYRKVKTVREFADLDQCSVSNFDKKFRQAFGTSAYRWMQKKKVDLLYHEINTTDKSLRQIAKEQKFLSLPQFNDYCKKHFGYPPGKMRKLASMFREKDDYIR